MRATLVEYIKKNLKKGYTLDTLKFSLISQGYSRVTIERSIEIAQKELADEVPKIKEKPMIRHEIYDSKDNLVEVPQKKSFWKRILGK